MRIDALLLVSVFIAAGCVRPSAIDMRGLPDGEGAIAVTASAIDILFPKIERDSVAFPRGDEHDCASPRLSWEVVFDVPPTAPTIPFRHFAFSVNTELLKRPQQTLSDVLTNGFLSACVAESYFLTCATSVDGSVAFYHNRPTRATWRGRAASERGACSRGR